MQNLTERSNDNQASSSKHTVITASDPDQGQVTIEAPSNLLTTISVEELKIAKELLQNLTIQFNPRSSHEPKTWRAEEELKHQLDLETDEIKLTPISDYSRRLNAFTNRNGRNLKVRCDKEAAAIDMRIFWNQRLIAETELVIPSEKFERHCLKFEEELSFKQKIDLDVFDKNLEVRLKVEWVDTSSMDDFQDEIKKFNFSDYKEKKERLIREKEEQELIEREEKQRLALEVRRASDIEKVAKNSSSKKRGRKGPKKSFRSNRSRQEHHQGSRRLTKKSTAEKLISSGPLRGGIPIKEPAAPKQVRRSPVKKDKLSKPRPPLGVKMNRHSQEKKEVFENLTQIRERQVDEILDTAVSKHVESSTLQATNNQKKGREGLSGLSIEEGMDTNHRLRRFSRMKDKEYSDPSIISPVNVAPEDFKKSNPKFLQSLTMEEIENSLNPELLKLRYAKMEEDPSIYTENTSPYRAAPKSTLSRKSHHTSHLRTRNRSRKTLYGGSIQDAEKPVSLRKQVEDYKQQVKLLKAIVYTLDQKLKGENVFEEALEELRTSLQQGGQAREEIRRTMLETTQELKAEQAKLKNVNTRLQQESVGIAKERDNYKAQNDALRQELNKLKSRNSLLEHQVSELNLQIGAGLLHKEELRKARLDLVGLERRSVEKIGALSSQVEDLAVNLKRSNEEKTGLHSEINSLREQLLTLKKQLNEEQSKSRSLKLEMDKLNCQMNTEKVKLDLLSSIRQQKSQVVDSIQKLETSNTLFLDKVGQLEVHLVDQSQKQLKKMLTQDEKLELQNGQIGILKRDFEAVKLNSLSLEKQNSELKEHTIRLEQLLCVKEDVYSELNEVTLLLRRAEKEAGELRATILENQKIIEFDAEKMFELEKTGVWLKGVIKEKDEVKFHQWYRLSHKKF